MSTSHRVELDCRATEVGTARNWTRDRVRSIAGDAQPALDHAQLVVSELVTNAVRAGCGSLAIEVVREGDCVRIMVSDDAPGTPTIGVAGPDATRGRGLLIVASLARDWGVQSGPDGKEVWALLPAAG